MLFVFPLPIALNVAGSSANTGHVVEATGKPLTNA
jgi:hypothetical protein